MNQNCKGHLTMHSRIFPEVWKLLQNETVGVTKYDIENRCYCDHRSAQRILTHLHLENEVYICGWRKAKKSEVRIPIYLRGNKPDAPRPVPVRERQNEYMRERRSDPERKEELSRAQKNKRMLKNAADTYAKLNDWQFVLFELEKELAK